MTIPVEKVVIITLQEQEQGLKGNNMVLLTPLHSNSDKDSLREVFAIFAPKITLGHSFCPVSTLNWGLPGGYRNLVPIVFSPTKSVIGQTIENH